MRLVARFLVCLAVFCARVGSAGAQDVPVTSTLSWTRLSGAEACPTLVQIAGGVEALLGPGVLSTSSRADRVIEASVAPHAGDDGVFFVANIQMASREGEVLGHRELPSHRADCADLAEGAALAIALMIDPDASLEPLVPAPPDPEDTHEVVVVERIIERPVPLGPPTRLTVDLGGAATVGVGPFVSGAGYLRVLLSLPGFVPFGVVGYLQPFSRAEPRMGALAFAVDFATVLAGVTICPLYLHGPDFSVGGCAGVDLGGMLVLGAPSAAMLDERERLLVQLDVQAHGRVTVWGPLAVQLLAALFVPFRNDPWRSAAVSYFAPEPVAGLFGVGLALDLTLAGDGHAEQHLP